ncbi:MAG: TraB/GumN family protein [Candidatus Woesearchaeota archaeon]
MHTYKNIHIIGTSHIAQESIILITKEFSSYNPDIICVELDHGRLHALLTNAKPDYSLRGIKKYGLQGYLFAIIAGFIQRKLGNVVGIKPGSDMLCAVNLARNNGKQLELIDQDIEITLKRFSKAFTFKEKMRIVWDIIRSPFSKKMRMDLSKIPKEELIHTMMEQLHVRYPSLYRVLIEERNYVMAKNIYRIMNTHYDKKIMIILGAGHNILPDLKREEHKRDKIY